jgi:predicted DNA-binding WGR domain protein
MAHDAIQYLVLDRLDPDRKMARYYVLSIEPSLFGDLAFTRERGRSGQPGQKRLEFRQDRVRTIETLETWLTRKKRRDSILQGCQSGSLI